MEKIIKYCTECKWAVYLNNKWYCLLAKNEVYEKYVATACDFYREDPNVHLHDDDAEDSNE